MKRTDIQIGRSYTDGRGNVRVVIAEGPNYVMSTSQQECDCVRYRVIARKRGPFPIGTEANCTRAAFASWAKEEFQKRPLRGVFKTKRRLTQ